MTADDNRMPAGIPYIVANEFAERFCYYGINGILAIYMTNFLHFGQAQATRWQSLFKAAAYFAPLLGAVVADVLWGKFRTILVFSLFYVCGCAVLALGPNTPATLAIGLGVVALGTGGIKPCVSTNVGDQFTSRNQHLIERAFSYFYISINAGSSLSILACPLLLNRFGPKPAFSVPAIMMLVATVAFWLGRKRFAIVPPAGGQWLRDVFSASGARLIGRLLLVYFFVALFWALWDQSAGQTWTLQATSDLMDKNLGFGITLLPAQISVANAVLILTLVPVFSYVVYPLAGRFVTVTPLRKIGCGLFVIAASFLIVGWIEGHIQRGERISVWWQVVAYVVLTSSEVLISITALEFSYKQAPLRMKSFIMALFLLSISLGNLMTAAVNNAMVRDLPGSRAISGSDTYVVLPAGTAMIVGQKIDFTDRNGLSVMVADGKTEPLQGTYLVAAVDGNRVRLMDNTHRRSVATTGEWRAGAAVSTYWLVGPQYFDFFAYVVMGFAVLFIVVAVLYQGQTYVREEVPVASTP